MVPNGWNVQSIESFCKVSSSKRIMQSDYVKEGVPFYRSKEIILKSKGIEPTDIIYIDVDKFAGLKGKFGAPEEGDILISAVGTLGKCYLVKKGEEFYFKDGNLLWLRELRGVEQLYLIQFMQSPYFQNEIQNMTGGSSQKALTIIKLAQMNLPLPSLPEQRKIATILGTWDKAISTIERLIDNSKQQKKALMQQLLTGTHTQRKRLLDDSGKPFEGEWEELSLHDIFPVIDSLHKTPKFSETGYPMVRVTDIKGGKLSLESTLRVNEAVFQEYTKKYKPKSGDIVFSRVGSYGNSSIVKTTKPFCLGQNTVIASSKKDHSSEYIYQFLNTTFIKRQIEKNVDGSSHKTVSLKIIRNLKLLIPCKSEQKKIADVLTNADKEIELLEQQLADLKKEKKALMQQLLTGKRRVKI